MNHTTATVAADEAESSSGRHEKESAPRSDFKDAIGWMLLGAASLIGAIRMDRLESQNINPLTVPGLLPGLLGIGMVLLGAVMGYRSWRRGALERPADPATPLAREQRLRVSVAIAMCLGYAVVLVGHGIPFWLASSIYVTSCILIFQRLGRNVQERVIGPRAIAKALAIGVIASVVIWVVFERVFLVRMP